MTLQEMIYRRKSCRNYTSTPVDEAMLETIQAFAMKPLYPEVNVSWEVIPRSRIKCICPWVPPQLIAVYSEEADGWKENVGFMFQQMDLYLQSLGLGACWLGLGRMKSKAATKMDGKQFVIMLAFGHPHAEALRHDPAEFKRKAMEKIARRADTKLEPARLAPSAVNSQPWYFVHGEDGIHIYCSKIGSRLDVGIALAQLYVANEETFCFFQSHNPPKVGGFDYVGSVKI